MPALQDGEAFLKAPQSLFPGRGQDGGAGGRVSHSPRLSPGHAAHAGGGRRAGEAASPPVKPCGRELLRRSPASCQRDPGQRGSPHYQPSPRATRATRIWSKFQQAKRDGSHPSPSAAPFPLGTICLHREPAARQQSHPVWASLCAFIPLAGSSAPGAVPGNRLFEHWATNLLRRCPAGAAMHRASASARILTWSKSLSCSGPIFPYCPPSALLP